MEKYKKHIGAWTFRIRRRRADYLATGVNVYDPDRNAAIKCSSMQKARNKIAQMIRFIRQ